MTTARPSTKPSHPGQATCAAAETAGYFSILGERIYYVIHRPEVDARAKVLLAGPLPDERTHAHLTWIRWARLLAHRGFEVMRFDYSGTGESEGRFETATLSRWMEEVVFCLERLGGDGSKPVVIHGLRMGGLIGARAFQEGYGDAVIAWDPSISGEALMIDAARRQQAANLVQGIAGGVPGPRAIAARLEQGLPVEINGYTWTPALWGDAKSWKLFFPDPKAGRPQLRLHLGRRAAVDPTSSLETVPISWPPFWVVGHRLIHEVDSLFERSLRFIDEVAMRRAPEVS